MTSVQRSFWNAFWLAMALVCAVSLVQAQQVGSSYRSQDNSDFGLSPDETSPNQSLVRRSHRDETSVLSLRERLIRERILDEDALSGPASMREPFSVRTRRFEIEDLPPVPATSRPLGSKPRDLGLTKPSRSDESERTPAPQPTVREKIERRYSDPRTLRLLEQLSARSAQSLFVEVAQLIDSRHIQPSSYAQRVDNAFEHLRLALDSSTFRQAVRIQADDRALSQLRQSLVQLQQTVRVTNLNDAVAVLNRAQETFDRLVQVQPGTVGLEFVHAEMDTLDQFSMLIPPEKVGGPSVGLKESVVGIGVEVEAHDEGLKVLKVLPGGPAAEVAMKRGDILTAVDGRSVAGFEVNQAVDYILGQAGTPLRLELVRDGRRGSVTLVRRKITLHTVASHMEDDVNKVGYVKLEQFTDSAVRELDEALLALHSQGMQSLILDLRGNPGGLLTAAISISDRFLPSGTIVSTRGRTPADNTKEEAKYAQTWKVPLVVLIDRNSASASEILAAAIQENGRGVIVGERSYGKGTVQTLFPLQSAPAGLRLTTAKFYSPDGREMAGAGVTPDKKVNAMIGNDASDDLAIAAALKVTADPRLKQMATQFVRTGEAPRVFRIAI